MRRWLLIWSRRRSIAARVNPAATSTAGRSTSGPGSNIMTNAGTGAYEGRREGGVHIRHMHGITPETENTTRYYFTQSRNFQIGDEGLTAKLHQLAELTFQEDKTVLEAQERRLAEDPGREVLNIKSDAGGVYARRIVEELYAAEHGATLAPAAR